MMRKKNLLQLISTAQLQNSNGSIFLLKEFLNSKKIQNKKKNEQISFKAYLAFIQKWFPNVLTFFKEPYLDHNDDKIIQLFEKYIDDDIKQKPIISTSLKYKIEEIKLIDSPASALTFLPDGKMLSSTDYYSPISGEKGKIDLRDAEGGYLKTLVNEPASALAISPDGNILSSTCYYTKYNGVSGEIVRRDPLCNRITTLVNEPASALAILPNGNILSGTCYYTKLSGLCGEIILRDPKGRGIKTLVKEPASSLTVLTNGNILSGTCYYDTSHYFILGDIVLRNSDGKWLQKIKSYPASTITILPNNYILMGTCYYSPFAGLSGEISLNTLTVYEKTKPTKTLPEAVEELLIDQAALACIQFHKGRYERRPNHVSFLCKLPLDLLKIIYSYVFPFPKKEASIILNPKYNASPLEATVKKVLLADQFANKIINLKFFEKKKIGYKVNMKEKLKQTVHPFKETKCKLM